MVEWLTVDVFAPPHVARESHGSDAQRQRCYLIIRDETIELDRINKAIAQPATDLRTYPRQEVIHNLLSQGNLVLELATEHVGATAVLIQNRAYAMALWTCARTATESSTFCAWLYDPPVDITERVSRSFAYRHEGLEQQRRLFNAGGGDTEAQAVTAQIDRVEREALDLGFAPVIDRNGRRIGIGQRMPEATTLVKEMFRVGGLYRLLSQAAHGSISSLRQLNYNPAVERALA